LFAQDNNTSSQQESAIKSYEKQPSNRVVNSEKLIPASTEKQPSTTTNAKIEQAGTEKRKKQGERELIQIQPSSTKLEDNK
jgi:hypothetical protein